MTDLLLEHEKLPSTYEYATVEDGERAVIYRLKLSGDFVAFINKIACDWYANTYWEFIVDGKLYEKFQRTIEMTEPDEYDPPIIAERWVKWVFYNNSGEERTVGVLVEGFMAKPII